MIICLCFVNNVVKEEIMNPLAVETKNINDYFLDLERCYPKAYNKKKAGPYTKCRVILMNGTEYEAVWFMHQFARHCDNEEILRALSIVRHQEQQQQTRMTCQTPLSSTNISSK